MTDAWLDADPVGQDHELLGGGHYLVTRYGPLDGLEALRLEAVGPPADRTALRRALAGWTPAWLWLLPGRLVERALFTRAVAAASPSAPA